jgi:hypothetical protein
MEYLLPNSTDWTILSRVYNRLNKELGTSIGDKIQRKIQFSFAPPFIDQNKSIFIPNLSDDYIRLSRLLSYLARDFWSHCPLPVINIVNNKDINPKMKVFKDVTYQDLYEETFGDEIEELSNIFKDSIERTSFQRYLDQLHSEKIISKITYNQWIKLYGSQASASSEWRKLVSKGNTQLFPLTARGTLFYEYSIHAPALFHSYRSSYFEPFVNPESKNSRSSNRYNTATYPLIFMSYASRKNRLSLFKNSFIQLKDTSKFFVHEYHEKIFNEQEQILGNDLGFFAEIHNPATKILREIRCLLSLKERYMITRSKRLSSNNDLPANLVEKLFQKKIDSDISILEELWTDVLELDERIINRYLPDLDI